MAHSSVVFLGKRYCCGACHNLLSKEVRKHGPTCEGRLLQRWFLQDDGFVVADVPLQVLTHAAIGTDS